MESSIIVEFIRRTGMDIELAHVMLQSVNWDIRIALKKWYEKNATKDDKNEAKKLARGVSCAVDNEALVSQARAAVANDFENNCLLKINNYFLDTPNTSFMLPSFSNYFTEFRDFLIKDLIEKSVMCSLENAERLNWWCKALGESNRLWPLSTSGDGNCLLHAASLSIYGFHDRLLTLRKALHHFLSNSPASAIIKRRWRLQQLKANLESGVYYSEAEWEKEWCEIVETASTKTRNSRYHDCYESLEEIHIFALASVLQRVIIVISETVLKDVYNEPLSPIKFGGIYLPLCGTKKCSKIPLLLTYDMGHFSALVFMEQSNTAEQISVFRFPIVDSNGLLLPVQFATDPGENVNWNAYVTNHENDEIDQLNVLKGYLNVLEDINNTTATLDCYESENEIEKHFIQFPEAESDSSTTKINKAAKQLEVLSKQFGSIGKSMGKKLKKLKPRPNKKTTVAPNKLICIEIQIKRYPYHLELVNNYLKFAENKFFLDYFPNLSEKSPDELALREQAMREGLLRCVNVNCNSFATCMTSYMCTKCYKIQKEREISALNNNSHGVGRSKFYREPEMKDYNALKNVPKSSIKVDRTIYLGNSTFFNDSTDIAETNKKGKTQKNINASNGVDANLTELSSEITRPLQNINASNGVDANLTELSSEITRPLQNVNASNNAESELLELISGWDFSNIVVPLKDESSSTENQSDYIDNNPPEGNVDDNSNPSSTSMNQLVAEYLNLQPTNRNEGDM